ncbi:translocase of the outer mitochondrial membrane [Coemansia spiralis]|nr:translocase of the outer mitochondrial membrane [Coemansia spiralis]
MNDTVKDVIVRGTAVGRFLVHWGYIPLILYIGYRSSSPKPPLARIFSPMA